MELFSPIWNTVNNLSSSVENGIRVFLNNFTQQFSRLGGSISAIVTVGQEKTGKDTYTSSVFIVTIAEFFNSRL